jgi:hypothetical protein
MKLNILISASFVVGVCASGAANAAGPPASLDRPTPPPCCADGICRPNPLTWGHYATRWRRWPTDYLEPLPAEAQPPAPLGPDVPGYEAPPAEEEDRRAPPPTAPRGVPEDEDQAPVPPSRTPAGGVPPTTPVEPTTPPAERPTTLPFGEPGEAPAIPPQPYDTSPPPTTLPFGGESPTTLPFGEPMGEVDPPPAPPFAAPSPSGRPADRAALPQRFQPGPRPMRAARPDDPPPAMPIAMSSWVN